VVSSVCKVYQDLLVREERRVLLDLLVLQVSLALLAPVDLMVLMELLDPQASLGPLDPVDLRETKEREAHQEKWDLLDPLDHQASLLAMMQRPFQPFWARVTPRDPIPSALTSQQECLGTTYRTRTSARWSSEPTRT